MMDPPRNWLSGEVYRERAYALVAPGAALN